MADLELRKRIELELLRFALHHSEKEEIGEKLMTNTDAENYVHNEIPLDSDHEAYFQFYNQHKTYLPQILRDKIELYVKSLRGR